MAPGIPPRTSEPPAATGAEASVPEASAPASSPAPGTPLIATPSASPWRKQTLLGIAPTVTPEPLAAAPAAEPVAEQTSSVSSLVTPAALTTDAPTTADVAVTAPEAEPPRAEPARAVAALSNSHDDLPELQPRRPRWLVPLGIAAALGLGIVGLRQLDRAPTAVPPPLAKPVNAAKAPVAAPTPQSNDDGDDGDLEPNTGTAPGPTPTEPDPLDAKAKAKAGDATPAPSAAAPQPSAAAAASAAPAASAGAIRINVDSDPPGARLFWKGKEVGTTPFVLEFQPGERHAYELGLPGYTTRKVVIDGSKTDIRIGLRPTPTAPSGGTRRK